MEILSEIGVLGSNMVDDNMRERRVKHQEGNTLATIRDIEKGLEANLQECMNFLQVLTEDNSRKGATAEWVSEDADGSLELEVVHATRPVTAPVKPSLHIHERLESAQRVSYEVDDSAVASQSSCRNVHTEAKKPRFQNVVTEVDLELDNVPRMNKKVYPHHDCSATKMQPSNLQLQLNGRIRTWSTESISETPNSTPRPQSVLSSTGSQNDKVSVCVRMRPFNEHEKVCPLKQVLCSQKDKVIVKDYNYLRQGNTANTKAECQFDVDYVLDDSFLSRGNRQRKEESQRCMYKILGKPCVENALDGYNTTIMAYGQMGSGKTYTMMGDGTLCGRGLVPRIVHELMHRVHEDQKSGACFSIQVSYLEIYQEKIRDLLVEKKMEQREEESGVTCSFSQTESPSAGGRGTNFSFRRPIKKDYIRIREHPVTGPSVEGLIWKDVATYGEMDKLVKKGTANRTLATNRGHTLFTVKLTRMQKNEKSKGTSVSFINLVDLAGSEKMALGQKPLVERTYESRYINRSLAQLNDVFTNLSSGRSNGKFVSYRSSALTWLLRESLCGSTKTILVANISPAEQDFQESVHTLKCAAKAKRIHGPSNQDSDTKKQICMKMDEEIRTLQYLIADLTKNTTQSSSELIKHGKKSPDEVEILRPTRETDGRSCFENVFQRRPASWR
ncbi:hypothetical protein M758_11G114200 [Ceratodon purpureus]|nr:hypothetical protein M758_11G114200 [Ceratodon purpureus]